MNNKHRNYDCSIEEIYSLKKERIMKMLQSLTPMDDIFFSVIIKEKSFCQELLQVILNDPELTVEYINSQEEIRNLLGRSIRVDAFCKLGNGKYVNIEIQKADNDMHVRRVRYNASILTNSLTKESTLFKDIPDIIIIYISAFDIFQQHQVYYEAIRQLKYLDGTIHSSEIIQNGVTEIYINTEVDDHSQIARLMKLFSDNEAYSEEFPNITEIKKRYQGTEGASKMYEFFTTHFKDVIDNQFNLGREEGFEEGREEGREEGFEEGREKTIIEMVLNMRKQNMQPEIISKITGLSLEQLLKI